MAKSWWSIHVDANTEPNPGDSYWGAVVQNPSQISGPIKRIYKGHLGSMTCNAAEVLALARALHHIPKDSNVVIFSDSQYLVEGYNGNYKITTNPEEWNELQLQIARMSRVIMNWIPRQMNSEADAMAKAAKRS